MDSATRLTTAEKLSISQRRNVLTVAYLMGDEGASLAQCMYTMYYMLWGTVNGQPDVINLLKTVQLSFACIMNPDRLEDVEQDKDDHGNTRLLYRPKNAEKTSSANCPPQFEGVNLKHNYVPSFVSDIPQIFKNPCSLVYAGVPGQPAAETSTLLSYLNQQGIAGVSMIVLSNNGQEIRLGRPSSVTPAPSRTQDVLARLLGSYLANANPGRDSDNVLSLKQRPNAESTITTVGPHILDDARTLAPRLVDTIELKSIKNNYLGTSFVPPETLKQSLKDPVSVLLLFACAQGACISTNFNSAATSLCASKKLNALCDGQPDQLKGSLLGLEVYVENSGTSAQSRAEYKLYIPSNMKLSKVVDISKYKDSTPKKLSELNSLLKSLQPLQFKLLRENLLNTFQEYSVELSDLNASSNITLLFIASSPPNPTGDVLFGLNVDPTKQTTLYSSRRAISSLPPPPEIELENDILEQTPLSASEESALKKRQLSFVLLLVYSGLAAVLVLAYLTHCAVLNWYRRPSLV